MSDVREGPIPQPEVEETAALEAQIMASLAQFNALPEMLKKWRRLYVEEACQLEEQAYIREEDIASLQKENHANKELLRNYEEAAQRHAEDAAQVKAENSAYKERIARLEEQNSAHVANITRLEEQNRSYVDDIVQLRAQNSAHADNVARLEKKNQAYTESMAGLKEKNRAYAEDITRLKEKNRAYAAEVARLKEENRTYTERIADVQSQLVEEKSKHAKDVVRLKERNRLYADEVYQLKMQNRASLNPPYAADKLWVDNENNSRREDSAHSSTLLQEDGHTATSKQGNRYRGVWHPPPSLRYTAPGNATAHMTVLTPVTEPARRLSAVSATLPGPSRVKPARRRAMNTGSDKEDPLIHPAASPPLPAASHKRLQLESVAILSASHPTKRAHVLPFVPFPSRPDRITVDHSPPADVMTNSPYSLPNIAFPANRPSMQNPYSSRTSWSSNKGHDQWQRAPQPTAWRSHPNVPGWRE